ncbi:MAG: caspase domain-containing protein, partial [Rhabdaerophilum calidifontis]
MRATMFAALIRGLALAAGLLAAVGAEAQGRRLGFVVGIGDYGQAPHPTALPDAALVAQSLKQAGFEVTEAANLSQADFRAAFRDFLGRAQAAGPDAVLALYLSGIGLQDDGENYLVPAGAAIRSRADLPLEALRLSDYLRALTGIPAAGRMVMLDAAYAHPLAEGIASGGRGFGLVERADGLLLAYNQDPGQAAPLPVTNYGHFAMALAEALREPGLDLGAIFERVRLRVFDLSQGREKPWNVNGISQPILLLAPNPGLAPAVPAAPELRTRPIGELPAEDAYARALERDTIEGYDAFLRAYPDHPQAKRIRALVAQRREAYYWQRARRANTTRAYWTYLRRYPRGAHAEEAEERLARLSAPVAPPPSFEEIIYDDLPPPPVEEVIVYETVIVEEDWHALPPPPPPPVHLLPPPPVGIIELAPPPPNPLARALPAVAIGVGAAILANRAWRRPAAVRPPAAAPPPRPFRP